MNESVQESIAPETLNDAQVTQKYMKAQVWRGMMYELKRSMNSKLKTQHTSHLPLELKRSLLL